MAGKNTATTDKSKNKKKSSSSENKTKSESKSPRQDGVRETIESIVIAFILAFLFRTFEAEAFVIPTGSMAPTLFGRHKVVECDKCHYRFPIGASEEVDSYGYLWSPSRRIYTAFCPNCRYETPPDTVEHLPAFKGDRILVTKFSYEFSKPNRWDVLVFKYPEDPKTNYIKRLVGLPGETIAIRQGDIYKVLEQGDSHSLKILRKDNPEKQKSIQLLVHDNDFPETDLHQQGWPERWASLRQDNAPGSIAGWSETNDGWVVESEKRKFHLNSDITSDGDYHWIRYRHFIPTDADWRAQEQNQPLERPRPQLIDDFCGYNATGGGNPENDIYYWVGDLTLNCQVDIEKVRSDAALLFELNEGFRKYRCRIDPNSGEATLFYPDPHDSDEQGEQLEVVLAKAITNIQGPGSYSITFANVDDRLCLWVNGTLTPFGTSADYQPFGAGLFPIQQPTQADLIPVGVAAKNLSIRVSHLMIQRDIYYRGDYLHPEDHYRAIPSMPSSKEYSGGNKSDMRSLLSDPRAWWEEFQSHLLSNDEEIDPSMLEFPLGPDEYFVLGDNSPRSRDSRLWPNQRHAIHRYAVPREALVGKAFFIYWPHGIPFLNDGKGYPQDENSWLYSWPFKKLFYHQQAQYNEQTREIKKIKGTDYPSFRIPFYPNVTRMKRIR
jgi:signal peptidase I